MGAIPSVESFALVDAERLKVPPLSPVLLHLAKDGRILTLARDLLKFEISPHEGYNRPDGWHL